MSTPSHGTATRVATIRVVLVDDHDVVRLGLRALLNAEPDIEVIGEGSNGHDAVALDERLVPDVMVMDLSMEGMDGATATREILKRRPGARIVVLTMHDEEEYLIPLLEAGAQGYVVKSAATTDLIPAVRTVAAGRVYVRPEAASVLAQGWTRRAEQDEAQARYRTLSDRERDVFRMVAQGYSAVQIGERLFISAKTVDTYRRRINEKLEMSDKADLVRLALRLGVLTEGK